MRILHTVELYAPSVGGAQEVVRQVSTRLAASGHDVTVATSRVQGRASLEIDGVRIVEFDVSGNAARGMTGEVARYQDFVRGGRFDVMMNYAAQQWATDAVFPLLGTLPYPAVLAPCGFSGLSLPDYADYFAAMPDVLKRYDHLVVHSDTYRDAMFARRHGIGQMTVIPNAADETEFEDGDGRGFRARHGIGADEPLLLSVGSHTGMKGHTTLIDAFRRARIGRAVLVLIGNVLSDDGCYPACRRRVLRTRVLSLGRKRVLLLDPPRDQVREAYFAADLFVLASNLECSPLVLFEAMASGTPFISTACGNAAEIAAWGSGGVVVDTRTDAAGRSHTTPETLAQAIERLWADPDERARLGLSGRRAWQSRFTWAEVARQYESLYTSIAGGP